MFDNRHSKALVIAGDCKAKKEALYEENCQKKNASKLIARNGGDGSKRKSTNSNNLWRFADRNYRPGEIWVTG